MAIMFMQWPAQAAVRDDIKNLFHDAATPFGSRTAGNQVKRHVLRLNTVTVMLESGFSYPWASC